MSYRADWNLILRNVDVFVKYKELVHNSGLPDTERELLMNGDSEVNPTHTRGCFLRAEHLNSVLAVIEKLDPKDYRLDYEKETYSRVIRSHRGKLTPAEVQEGDPKFDVQYKDEGHYLSQECDVDTMGIPDEYIESLRVIAIRRSDGAVFETIYGERDPQPVVVKERRKTFHELPWRQKWIIHRKQK